MRRDAFSHYHPIVNMLYFVLVIGAGMALRHGVCQVLGLVLAFSYCIALEGSKVWKMLRWLVPLCLCSTVINMFVSHEGKTVLFTLWGADITMESTLYGLSSAVMLMTVILWFRAFSVVITTDKFLYLFSQCFIGINGFKNNFSLFIQKKGPPFLSINMTNGLCHFFQIQFHFNYTNGSGRRLSV